MSDNNLSGKVGLDVTDYKAGVSELNRQIKVIESGFRASAAAMGDWDKNANGLEMRTKALTSQIDLQKQKISALTSEYEKVVEAKGADSRAAQDLEIKINKQKQTLGEMTVELEKTNSALDEMGNDSKDAGGKVQDLGDKQEQTTQKSESFKSALGGMATALKATVAAAAAVALAVVGIAAGIGKMILSSASAADNLAEMSAKTGISVERLQELSFIGKQTGTDLETITGANAKLIRSMAEAGNGTSAASQAFKKLKIDVDDGNGSLRDSKVVFQEAMEKLAAMPNETERDAMAMALFGKSAQELNPLIKTSAEDLADMTEQAHGLGAVMSDQAVAGLSDLNDMLDGLKDGLKGTLGEISAAFLPGIKGMSTTVFGYMRDLVDVVQGSKGDLGAMAGGIGGLLGKIVTDIAGKGPELLQGGLGIIQGIMDAVIGNLPTMLPAVVTMIQTLVNFLIQNLPMLIDAAVQILLMLVNSLISMLPMLLTAAIQIIIQLANGLSAALPTLIPAVEGIIGQLMLTLMQNLPMLITAALQLILALAQGLIAALPVLADQTPTIIIALIDGLIQNLPSILIAAVQIILTLALGLIENIPKLLMVLPQIIDALVKEFKSDSFKVKMKSMGEEIVNGIGDGFKKAWDTFISNLRTNVDNLVKLVKDLLGIHSPSTVFAEIGANMALGLGGGFSKQMAAVTQQIQNAMAGMSVDPMMNTNMNVNQSSAAGQQSVSSNGNTYQAYFETYNEAQFNRYLRQTEMLYGS